jgi:hypothetical protein
VGHNCPTNFKIKVMIELTEEQIQSNWEELINFIKTTFSGERKERLLKLYNDLEERIILSPASGKEHFHGAYPGGYVVHVLNVINFTKKLQSLWVECGHVVNYKLEELLFCALNHDLGKVGDIEQEYYVPNESEWHKTHQGLIYGFNPKITFMTVPHRSIFILQHYGIDISQQEFITILLHDGLYDDGNKDYLISYKPENQLRTSMPIILNNADMMASTIECERWRNENPSEEKSKKKEKKKTIKDETTFEEGTPGEDIYNALFGSKKIEN